MRGIRRRRHTRFYSLFVVLAACGGGNGGGGSSSAPPIQTPAPAPVNRAPLLETRNAPQRPIENHPYRYDVTGGGAAFRDPDGDPLTYQVSAPRLPQGLTLTGTIIEGVPTGPGSFTVVQILASDGRGGETADNFDLLVVANSPPVVANPNRDRLVSIGEAISIDALQGGATFTEPDGDPLTIELSVRSATRGLFVDREQISGFVDSVGSVQFALVATDGFGGRTEDAFFVAVAGPEPGRPTLPSSSFIYADEELPLPEPFRLSREIGIPFTDTTPPSNPTTNAGATLGRVLFYDRRLSVTNSTSCASCHEQARGFGGGERTSVGFQGARTPRHAMALANVRYNIVDLFFSDQRARTLESLALMPIEDPIELGNSLDLLETKLAATDFYPPLFEAAFGTPEVTRERIARALAQFLRAMISYRSKFDVAHENQIPGQPPDLSGVLTAQEMRGKDLFANGNCHFCHTDRIQAFELASNNGLDASPVDQGAGDARFRAPSLRNIAVSAPYMHDGRFATLREVIDHYDSGVQSNPALGFFLRNNDDSPRRLNMSDEEKAALEAFLNTLTDQPFLTDPKFSDPFQ